MSALIGQVISTISDSSGVVVEVTWFYDPTTRVLRNNPIAWTDADGTVWPVNSGALIGNNMSGRQLRITISNAAGTLLREVSLVVGGRAIKAAALAAQTPAFTSADDLVGMTFDLS